jgi:hypothetical protein
MFHLRSKNIFWKAFSPFIIRLYGGQCGDRYDERAAISSHIHRLIGNGADELSAVHKAFSSRDLPDMAGVLATCIFFLLVLNLQGFRIVLPLRSHEEPTLQINKLHNQTLLSLLCTPPLPGCAGLDPILDPTGIICIILLFWLTLSGPIAIAPNVRNGANLLGCDRTLIFETYLQVNRC